MVATEFAEIFHLIKYFITILILFLKCVLENSQTSFLFKPYKSSSCVNKTVFMSDTMYRHDEALQFWLQTRTRFSVIRLCCFLYLNGWRSQMDAGGSAPANMKPPRQQSRYESAGCWHYSALQQAHAGRLLSSTPALDADMESWAIRISAKSLRRMSTMWYCPESVINAKGAMLSYAHNVGKGVCFEEHWIVEVLPDRFMGKVL